MENTQILELVSMVIGVVGTLLVTYKNKLGFLTWIFGNFLWVAYGLITKQYFFMFQYVVFVVLAIFGFYKWYSDETKLNKKKNKK